MLKSTVKFITLTNNEYVDYTLNCLKSLENIDFTIPLNSYSLGDDAHNILQSCGYKSHSLRLESINDSQFNTFRKGNWHNVTKRKFEIIHRELKKNEYVCFTDGDVVFLDRNFMNYCFDYIQNTDMVIQNDTLSDSDCGNLCSGFMFIKSNNKTLDIFDPKNVEKYVKPGWDDQIYINKVKNKLDFKVLPLELFPNGKYYYDNYKKLFPMMIHFNWVIGHQKQMKMILHSKWYQSLR